MARSNGQAILILSLAVSSMLPAITLAFHISSFPLLSLDFGPVVVSPGARSHARLRSTPPASQPQLLHELAFARRRTDPCLHLHMQDKTTKDHKKVFPGRPKDPEQDGILMSKVALSDAYKEDSRMYRRTVFEPEDWKKFRSSYRIVRNLESMFTSGVIRGLWLEIGAVSTMALFVLAWNKLLMPEIGNSIPPAAATVLGPLHLPTLPFTISSPALGLLLVFRTNTCYARWKEGGQAWMRIAEHCKGLARMGVTYVSEEDKEEFLRRIMAVPRAYKSYLRGGAGEREERNDALQALLGSEEARRLTKREELVTSEALMDVAEIVKRNSFESSTRAGFDKHLDGLTSSILFCDRLLKTPVPLVYTRHTSRFLALWMILLPLALYDQLTEHWLTLPITAVVAIFFFGIEELGVQIEEPFSILPLGEICDNIEVDVRAMLRHDREIAEGKKKAEIGADAEGWA